MLLVVSDSVWCQQMPLRPRIKRVNMRDLMFLMEQEKELNKSPLLYRSYLK